MAVSRNEWTVLSMLEWATDYFKQKGVPEARLSIEWLLADTLEVKRLDLYMLFERPLAPSELDELRPLIKRRARHEPLQHITGYSQFMNARIKVSPEVLIPRIETEQLVEIMLDDISPGDALSVLDIGTGSGCIPIALKLERPAWQLTGLDISEEALAISRKNARQNEVDISWKAGDFNAPESLQLSSFDVIVSNPPYITPEEKDALEPQVKKYEPALALYCQNVEAVYQNIVDFAADNLNPNGWLYLEINPTFSDQILACFETDRWQTSLLKDYAHKARFIRAKLLT